MESPLRSGFAIRRALATDAVAMARVHSRSWRVTYAGLLPKAIIDDVVASRPARVERWRTWLADSRARGGAFVAELQGQLVGFVFWGPSEDPEARADTAEVHAIYLDPTAIGHGIGRALFTAAVDDVVAKGFTTAVLWVLDTNARARRFYEAAGWRPDGATKAEVRPAGTLREVRYARALTALEAKGK